MVNSWKDIALSKPSNGPVYDEAKANKSTKGGSSTPDQGKIRNLPHSEKPKGQEEHREKGRG